LPDRPTGIGPTLRPAGRRTAGGGSGKAGPGGRTTNGRRIGDFGDPAVGGRRSARPAWLAGQAEPSRDLCTAVCPPRTGPFSPRYLLAPRPVCHAHKLLQLSRPRPVARRT